MSNWPRDGIEDVRVVGMRTSSDDKEIEATLITRLHANEHWSPEGYI